MRCITTLIYLYSQGNVCYEKNLTTGFEAVYIYGFAGRIAKRVGEEVMYYHTDHLGSVRLVTDRQGNQEEEKRQFKEGWEAGKPAGSDITIEQVKVKAEKDIGNIEQSVECLLEKVSDKVVRDIGLGFVSLSTPEEQALRYACKMFDELASGEIPPPTDLKKFCEPQEKEEEPCSGTTLLMTFVVIGIVVVFARNRKRRFL